MFGTRQDIMNAAYKQAVSPTSTPKPVHPRHVNVPTMPGHPNRPRARLGWVRDFFTYKQKKAQ